MEFGIEDAYFPRSVQACWQGTGSLKATATEAVPPTRLTPSVRCELPKKKKLSSWTTTQAGGQAIYHRAELNFERV